MAIPLKDQFGQEVLELYRRCFREIGYRAKGFLEMITMMGAVEATRSVINSDRQPEGFLRLYREDRLDLSVEALLVEHSEYRPLFHPEEIDRAARRLIEAGYVPKGYAKA